MENKITIEKLAQMIQRGFEETATKEQVENFQKEVENRFQEVDGRFHGVGLRFDSVELRLDLIESEIKNINIRDLQFRITRLEKKVGLV